MRDAMLQHVLRTPELLQRGAAATLPALAPARDIVLLGMGGSGMAARAAALEAHAPECAVTVHQGYGLPPWAAARRALVIAVSYSGNTDEVLSGVRIAIDAGLPLVTISAGGRLAEISAASPSPHLDVEGGMQPRAALGLMAAGALRALEAAGAVEDVAAVVDEAATVVDDLLGEGRGAGFALGEDIGAALDGRIPVVVGCAGPGGLAARRWVTQINENAKRVAIAAELPEANHNALEAWASASMEPAPYGLVALHDPGFDHRTERRLALTVRGLGANVTPAGEVAAAGTGALARFMSLVVVGDVASVVMAERAGIEATPVEALESFKDTLRKEAT